MRRPARDPGRPGADSGSPDGGEVGEAGFVERVLEVIESIPSGEVLTYGDVAAIVGSRGARAVGQVLARYGSGLPWWRVVKADGSLLKGYEAEALDHYEREGVPLRSVNGRRQVDVRAGRWQP